MKILANPEILLVNSTVSYHLPHLAIELFVNNSGCLQDGNIVGFETRDGLIKAVVFKPGGDRLIFKNFHVSYIELQPISWFQKLLKKCQVKNNIYWTKSYKDVEQEVTVFFENAGKEILKQGFLCRMPLA